MENKSKYFKMVEEFLKREFIKQTSEDLNLKVKIKKSYNLLKIVTLFIKKNLIQKYQLFYICKL